MRLEETHKPKLAPATARHMSVKNRGDLSRRDYSHVLATRSTSKLEKIRKQRQEDEYKEIKDCTFNPKLNKRAAIYRDGSSVGSSSFGGRPKTTRSGSGRGNLTDREKYVDNFLYKPKQRKDRSTEDVEFEK